MSKYEWKIENAETMIVEIDPSKGVLILIRKGEEIYHKEDLPGITLLKLENTIARKIGVTKMGGKKVSNMMYR